MTADATVTITTADADADTAIKPYLPSPQTTHDMSNTFGHIYRLTSFGESHGPGIGGVIDGFPAGIEIDLDFIQGELNRRRPGQSQLTTPRKEADKVELLSGVFEGKSTGCPIGFLVRNTNQHSGDYDNIRNVFRPSHADFTYTQKYGLRDHTGGGRSSARETISRCVAGALAKLALRQMGIEVYAYTSQVGNISLDRDYRHYDLSLTESNDVRCPDAEKAAEMAALISEVKAQGDTIGGIITGVIKGCPAGLGEPHSASSMAFGRSHAQHQRRERIRVWTRICRRDPTGKRTKRRVHQRQRTNFHPNQP